MKNLPPKIQHFNNLTMWVMCIAFFGMIGTGVLGYQSQSPIFMLLTVSLFLFCGGWMIYRAVVAVPRCPTCKLQMRHIEDIEENLSEWRIYQCDKCRSHFRIPGLSNKT